MVVTRLLSVGIFLLLPLVTLAAVLPEERADVLFHSYDGGGVTIDGPSVLVRKNFRDKVSVYGNYYVDQVSSASIDVITTASPYTEERKEYSLGVDYLNDRTLMSVSFTNSSESDYEAQTIGFGISQEFFGDLSTITLGFSLGDDEVMDNSNDTFKDTAERKRFSFGFSQIITPRFVMSLNAESVIDEGFLNNPYRTVRFVDPLAGNGYSYQDEIYPRTRNSDAFSIKGIYYLPYRASIKAEYRVYSDSWGVEANNAEIRYTHAFRDNWLFELRYRQYDQTQADFYSDLFPFLNSANFLARDKELSTFNSQQYGIGITYKFKENWLGKKSTINVFWDHFTFDYENFSDLSVYENGNPSGFSAGNEPSYSLDADVIRVYFSVWF